MILITLMNMIVRIATDITITNTSNNYANTNHIDSNTRSNNTNSDTIAGVQEVGAGLLLELKWV